MAILKLKKSKFHCNKDPILLNDMNIDNILISNRISSSENNYKYFTRYPDQHKTKPFTITLPKTSPYVESYYSGATN